MLTVARENIKSLIASAVITEMLEDGWSDTDIIDITGYTAIEFDSEIEELEKVIPIESIPAVLEAIYCMEITKTDHTVYLNRLVKEVSLYTKLEFAKDYIWSSEFKYSLDFVSRLVEYKRRLHGEPLLVGWNGERTAVAAHIVKRVKWESSREQGLYFVEELEKLGLFEIEPDYKQPIMV